MREVFLALAVITGCLGFIEFFVFALILEDLGYLLPAFIMMLTAIAWFSVAEMDTLNDRSMRNMRLELSELRQQIAKLEENS